MKELTLQELKDTAFNTLKVFDAFCKENGIKYFLAYGTLLGAIRYKKFIPWDDDIDLLIPREDYNRMISLFKDTERYRLYAFEKNENYKFPFAKLCDMTTLKDEIGFDNGVQLGVDIDLFPLDYWDDDIEKAKREAKSIKRTMFCLDLTKIKKAKSKSFVKRIIKAVMMCYCKLRGSKYFIRKIIRKSCNKNQIAKNYMGCKTWCIYGDRGIVPAQAFAKSVEVEFEGKMFPAPQGYDAYLTSLYGDYLPEPPKEKQKTHHGFKAYRI